LLKRGFKSQCERRSVEIRKGFELKPDDPLSAFALAQNMDVVVWNEQNIEDLSEADFRQLTQEDFDSWSAFTMRVEDRHLVVYNSTQSAARQNSVLMHELSHIMLGHELTSASLTEDGHFVPTTYDQDQEDEADWLAGTLLLPRPALLKIRYSQMTDQSATEYFKVSNQMLIWRFRMTGVDYQILAARNRAS
jgi:Zn-dependent peptidase ImmA (M78 family)